MHGERFLGPLHRDDPGVPAVREVRVEELEPRRRLDVRELEIGDVDQAEQGTARARLGAARPGRAEVVPDQVRLARPGLDGPVRSQPPLAEHRPRPEPALRGQQGMAPAHASSPAAGSEAADTSTGSRRMVSVTRPPAVRVVASDVGS